MNRILMMVLKNFWIVPGAYMKLCRYAKHTDKYSEEEKYKHIQYILKKGVKSGNIDLEVFGLENIPEESGFMFYANHQGLFDIVAICARCDKPWAVVLKKELQNIPFLDQLVACTKSYYMDREDVKQSMTVIKNVTEEVKNGRNYLIFPEGTRSKKGNRMLEFHGGSFKCALKAKCPIVPIAFINSYKVFDEKGSKPVKMQMHFLKPIPYEEFAGLKTVELAKLVHDRIEDVIDEYAPEIDESYVKIERLEEKMEDSKE